MDSMVEDLVSPESVAAQALCLMQQMAPLVSAVIWGNEGGVPRRLAVIGQMVDALAHPCVPSMDADGNGGQRLLCVAGEPHGWLVWRDASTECANTIGRLVSGQWRLVQQADEQARARVIQDTLLEINQLAAECHDAELFFSQVHHLLSRLSDVENFYIALRVQESPVESVRFPFYRTAYASAAPAPDPEKLFPVGAHGQGCLLARCLQSGCSVLLGPDEVSDQLESDEPLPAFWLGVPLLSSTGEVSGVVVVQRYPSQSAFLPVDQRVLQFVCQHIGAALDRLSYHSQLEKQVWLRTCELEGANARLLVEAAERQRTEKFQTVLFNIAELANTSLSLEAFLGGLHRLLSELVSARNFQVALYDMEHDLLRFPYCVDEHHPSLKPRKPGQGLIEQILHSGQPLLVNNHQMREGDGTAPLPMSWLGVPLYCSHELMGVLSVQRYEAGTGYSFRDQEVLEYVANTIGNALARVRALENLQLANNELERRVRERTRELDAVNAQLQFDSTHDSLTKLPNRSFFAKTLRRAWEAFRNGTGERFAVFFIDLDRFKLVNDTLGHMAGDNLLFEAGARLRSCLRHYDFMARLGGDEFAILLFGMDQIEGCEQIARRMVSEFERPIILAGREVFTTASIGVVIADKEHYRKADELLRDADHAMYYTKQQGRHGYTLFNHELRLNQADQLAMETELRRALEDQQQLLPYYQPFVDARTGALVGFETLVRWNHPVRGLMAPSLFLPLAEESRLIMRLDRYMINASCAQLRLWLDQGLVSSDISLHINLSSANFHDPELVSWIEQVIERYDLPARMLHLEVTESALIDVPEIAASVMRDLHALGVRLALDDFGTGYSALSYLHRYHFDVLKIDQSFVFDLDSKEESVAIVRAILALASALSLDVVAEGVETLSQFRHLRAMGCAKLQGYYFSPPVPANEIDWFRLASFERECDGGCHPEQ